MILSTDELRRKDTYHQLRFITDNTRWESSTVVTGGSPTENFMNLSAGEMILRFLRGRLYKAPVLVYCCLSISLTTYVRSYEQSGSTTASDVCLSYILALANGEIDDMGWQGFQSH